MATKKKAPKAKKPKKEPLKASAQITVVVPPLNPVAPGPKPHLSPKLRLEAQAVYLQDMDGCTVEDLHRDPRFKDIALTTLRRWAHEDRWADSRKIAYQNLQKRLTTEAASRLTDRLYYEVQNLLDMQDNAKKLMASTEPKSWEGVAKISMEINKRLFELQQMMEAGVIDDLGKSIQQEQKSTTPQVSYDKEYLKGLTAAYIQARRSELREKLKARDEINAPKEAAHEPEEEGDAKGPAPGPVEYVPGPDDNDLAPEISVPPPMGANPGGHQGNGG